MSLLSLSFRLGKWEDRKKQKGKTEGWDQIEIHSFVFFSLCLLPSPFSKADIELIYKWRTMMILQVMFLEFFFSLTKYLFHVMWVKEPWSQSMISKQTSQQTNSHMSTEVTTLYRRTNVNILEAIISGARITSALRRMTICPGLLRQSR